MSAGAGASTLAGFNRPWTAGPGPPGAPVLASWVGRELTHVVRLAQGMWQVCTRRPSGRRRGRRPAPERDRKHYFKWQGSSKSRLAGACAVGAWDPLTPRAAAGAAGRALERQGVGPRRAASRCGRRSARGRRAPRPGVQLGRGPRQGDAGGPTEVRKGENGCAACAHAGVRQALGVAAAGRPKGRPGRGAARGAARGGPAAPRGRAAPAAASNGASWAVLGGARASPAPAAWYVRLVFLGALVGPQGARPEAAEGHRRHIRGAWGC